MAVRNRSKLHLRLLGVRIRQSRVSHSGKFMKLLSRDHERGQVGRVDGQEDYRKHGPDVGHKASSESTGRVYVHGGLEENCPDQPICAKERESVRVLRLGHFASVTMEYG